MDSFAFHWSATSLARGSSGLGALSNAWIDSRTVLICRAGLHLSAGRGREREVVRREGGVREEGVGYKKKKRRGKKDGSGEQGMMRKKEIGRGNGESV